MKYLFHLLLIQSIFAQLADNTEYFNYFAENTNNVQQLGQGNSGIADASNFSNMAINPAVFYTLKRMAFNISFSDKSKSDFTFGTSLLSKGPSYNINFFYGLSKDFNILITSRQNRSFRWKLPTFYALNEEGDPTKYDDNFYDQLSWKTSTAFAYRLTKTLSFGFALSYHVSEVNQKYAFLDEFSVQKNKLSTQLGLYYVVNKDLSIGLSYQSPFEQIFSYDVKLDNDTLYFRTKNSQRSSLSLGIHYQIDLKTKLAIDLSRHQLVSDDSGLFKTSYYNFNMGLSTSYTDNLTIRLGAFSFVDARDGGTENWSQENGYFSQIYLTTGASYTFNNILISFAYATSDIISTKKTANSRYGFGISYQL